jgi:hypothetical protein
LNTYGDGKRFVVRADEKLTAFMEFESAVSSRSVLLLHKSKPHSFSAACIVEKTGGVQTTVLQLFNPISRCV